MRLSELITRAGCGERSGPDPDVTAVVTDSRQAVPGALFVAVRGRAADGRAWIHDAVARGAVAVALAGAHPVPGGVARLAVESDRLAAGAFAAAFRGDPSRDLDVVGVTGTNGKTTTSWCLESALAAAGLPPALLGTIRTRVGTRDEPSECTTPGPAALQRLLARARDAGHRHVVAEVSSHALDQDRLHRTELAVAVVTNVTRDHLDYHGTPAAYRAAKVRILEHLRPGGALVVNADDPGAVAVAAAAPDDCRVLRCSLVDGTADVAGSLHAGGELLEITSGSECVTVRPPLAGEHNASNVLLAAAAARGLGFTLAEVARGLEVLPGVPGRMERVAGAPFDVVVDYAHTPDAFERVLGSLRAATPGRLIVVFGCGGDKDRGKRPEMGRIAEACGDLVVVTSDNPRSESAHAIAGAVISGMRRPEGALVVHDRVAAVECALDEAVPGDCVALLGKGHETEQVVGAARSTHDDRAVVRRWVARCAAVSAGEAGSC